MKKGPDPITSFETAKRFVEKACSQPKDSHYKDHLFRTADWIKTLQPSADEALLTAAVLHDIERVMEKPDPTTFKSILVDFTDPRYLAWHQEKSADIASAMLREKNINENLIKRVYALIRHHEVGGDDGQNLLKDADSLSFFETGVEHFLDVWVPVTGKEKVRKKFKWMFERITSQKAKRICEPLFRSALERLESLKQSLSPK